MSKKVVNPARVASPGKSAYASDFKFTQNTDEYKILKSMMEGGEVTASTRPQDVKCTREEFQKIKGDKFRAQFNKLKNLYGIGTREGKCVPYCWPPLVGHYC